MLAFIMLINRSGAMVIPFLGVYMTQSLHFTLNQTGVVLSCFGVGAVCGSWLGGWLTDKVGQFYIQFFCLLLCVPVYCVLPLLTTPVTLAVGVFVQSLVSETFRPANSVSIASYTKPENITKAFSLNRMAMNLGFSIGPALGGFLAAFSYHWLFYGNAISCGLAGIMFYLFFKDKAPRKLASHQKIKDKNKGISPWKDSRFLLFSILCCLYSVCFFQLLNTLPLFYREVHHLSEWDIGLILAFSGLVVFSLEMLLVHLAERKLTASAIIILGTLICGISYSMLVLPGKFLLLYTSIFLLCISEILAMPFMATITMRRAPENRQGAYMGLNALSFSAAHVLSPLLGTRVANDYGFNTLWILIGGITLLTSVGFWWVIKKLKAPVDN
ncbi:MFS transporter [Pseudopedobacter beijingensis]|uniref:MFS transporter n=1 Tax=Pseudopedobacter beijingensis TaxID=1207056 RepID=A0ABW4IF59_9SPHI